MYVDHVRLLSRLRFPGSISMQLADDSVVIVFHFRIKFREE